jgi:hypothetical protein
MDPVTHLLGLLLIALIIAGLGAALAVFHAFTLRISLTRWPQPLPLVMAVAAPALGWAGFGLYLLALMAADPTAANLWPLTLALMAFLWICWIAATATIAGLVRLARRLG